MLTGSTGTIVIVDVNKPCWLSYTMLLFSIIPLLYQQKYFIYYLQNHLWPLNLWKHLGRITCTIFFELVFYTTLILSATLRIGHFVQCRTITTLVALHTYPSSDENLWFKLWLSVREGCRVRAPVSRNWLWWSHSAHARSHAHPHHPTPRRYRFLRLSTPFHYTLST